jgi:hypothetical protein
MTLIAETFAGVKRMFIMNYTQFSTQIKFCKGWTLLKFIYNIKREAVACNVEGAGVYIW